ncbi:hypothetical protein [Streptosporangium sp. NPDC003464]
MFGLTERIPDQKVSVLDEAVRIICGLWDAPAVSFNRRRFQAN